MAMVRWRTIRQSWMLAFGCWFPVAIPMDSAESGMIVVGLLISSCWVQSRAMVTAMSSDVLFV